MPSETTTPELDFDAWLAIGRDSGWISRDVCGVHYGTPTSVEEDESEDCAHILRLYPDAATKEAVERDFPMARWPSAAALTE
jgi:hypothetical protein